MQRQAVPSDSVPRPFVGIRYGAAAQTLVSYLRRVFRRGRAEVDVRSRCHLLR